MQNKSYKPLFYRYIPLLIATVGILLPLFLPSTLCSYDLEKQVQVFTLNNGLRVLMLERHLSPTVSIYICYRAGAMDEAEGKTGTAHLLEHMMFKGTKTIGTRNYLREEKILGQIGEIGNALDIERRKGKESDQAILDRLTRTLKTLQIKQRQLTVSNEIDRLYKENGAVDLNASTGHDLTTYRVGIPANRIELWLSQDRVWPHGPSRIS